MTGREEALDQKVVAFSHLYGLRGLFSSNVHESLVKNRVDDTSSHTIGLLLS